MESKVAYSPSASDQPNGYLTGSNSCHPNGFGDGANHGDINKRDRCAFCKSNGERETVFMRFVAVTGWLLFSEIFFTIILIIKKNYNKWNSKYQSNNVRWDNNIKIKRTSILISAINFIDVFPENITHPVNVSDFVLFQRSTAHIIPQLYISSHNCILVFSCWK